MKTERLLVFGDRHYPKQDVRTDNILFQLIKDVNPDYIIDLGDGINADCLSNFDKSSVESVGKTLQGELKGDSVFRQKIQKLSPKSKKILLKCNHFSDRLKRLEKKLPFLEGLAVWKQEVLQDLTNWKLYEDFISYQETINDWFSKQPKDDWQADNNVELYQHWTLAFKMASVNGSVCFL